MKIDYKTTSHKSCTPRLTSYKSCTPRLTSYKSCTPRLTSYKSCTPGLTSYKSCTPMLISHKSCTPRLTSYKSCTPRLTSHKSCTLISYEIKWYVKDKVKTDVCTCNNARLDLIYLLLFCSYFFLSMLCNCSSRANLRLKYA